MEEESAIVPMVLTGNRIARASRSFTGKIPKTFLDDIAPVRLDSIVKGVGDKTSPVNIYTST